MLCFHLFYRLLCFNLSLQMGFSENFFSGGKNNLCALTTVAALHEKERVSLILFAVVFFPHQKPGGVWES